MRSNPSLAFLVLLGALFHATAALAEDVHPLAILGFQERGVGVKGYGEKVGDLIFASLVASPDLYLVDRSELEKTLQEQQLNLSGLVQPEQAIQVGQLTGAQIVVAGTVIEADQRIYLVAKIIGTETSRVLGASVKGSAKDELAPLAEELAKQISQTVKDRAGDLIAKRRAPEDLLAAIKQKLGDAKLPSLCISVEERHIGQSAIDPAAETELSKIGGDVGFMVLDSASGGRQQADVLIEGAGFSELAGRRGDLVSVKARLEIKALDRASGKVLATERQTVVVVDLAEQVAGKSALEQAAAQIAERVLPKLATAE